MTDEMAASPGDVTARSARTTRVPPVGRVTRLLRLASDALLVGFAGAILLALFVGQALPRLGHPVLVVGGPSMEPAIAVGSAIVLSPVRADQLDPGDIVSLKVAPGAAIFTHRIVRTVDRDGAIWIETKGDANATPDPSLTPASAVIGRVDASIAGLGFLLALLSTSTSVLFVIGVGGSLLAISWLLESSDDGADARTDRPVEAARRADAAATGSSTRRTRIRARSAAAALVRPIRPASI